MHAQDMKNVEVSSSEDDNVRTRSFIVEVLCSLCHQLLKNWLEQIGCGFLHNLYVLT